MLIHQVRSGLWGSFAEFQDEIQNLELIMRYIKQIYLEHTNIPESDLVEILKHDTYLNAEECIKYGLVDEIV
jgi:ATP-dependent protease ClpP protease subunit